MGRGGHDGAGARPSRVAQSQSWSRKAPKSGTPQRKSATRRGAAPDGRAEAGGIADPAATRVAEPGWVTK
ncbi:hypothetical protein GCM10010430_22050 [Kitasatospora cystarginea]|uniref:Uncharacterized protein n=1 Tax=Kitasatospora cystarginea TaxID=58350 RepID=A0ABN3DS05_9ACTN